MKRPVFISLKGTQAYGREERINDTEYLIKAAEKFFL